MELTASAETSGVSLNRAVFNSKTVPVAWENFTEWVELIEGWAGYEGVHGRVNGSSIRPIGTIAPWFVRVFILRFSFHSREALFGGHEGGLQGAFLQLQLTEHPLGFSIHLLAFKGFAELFHFAGVPGEFEFEAFDAFLENPRTLSRPALFPCDCVGVHPARNGFSALTDREFVLTGVLAVLDFAEAEVLGVGVGNDCVEFARVHIAMMFWIWCLLSPAPSGAGMLYLIRAG